MIRVARCPSGRNSFIPSLLIRLPSPSPRYFPDNRPLAKGDQTESPGFKDFDKARLALHPLCVRGHIVKH
jgi:hypothetical protein